MTDAEETAYSITLSDISKQVIDDVRLNLIAELPAVNEFLKDPENAEYVINFLFSPHNLKIGSVKGTEVVDIDPKTQGYEKTVDWLFEPTSTWTVASADEK